MSQAQIELGVHTFIWSPRWDRVGAETAAAGAARAGLRLIEIPLLEPATLDVERTVATLAHHGLRPTCSLALPAAAHAPDHPDAAVACLCTAIDCAAAIGSEWLTGALYGHLGRLTGAAPTRAEIRTIAEVLQRAADHATPRGIRLGLEVINRYETHLVNTVEQVLELLGAVDRPGRVYAHLDTFHMNIEEADIAEAVRRLGDRLGYVHLAESNRGVLGNGTFPFRTLFDALSEVGFAGPAVIEAFLNAPSELKATTASWRPLAEDADEFLAASIAHLTAAGTPSRA